MVKRRAEPRPLLSQVDCQLFHLGAGRHENSNPAFLLHDMADITVVQEFFGLLRKDLHLGLERRIEGLSNQHLRAVEVLGVEGWVHRGAQPDKPATGALAQRQAKLELGRGLMDLVYDYRIPAGDEVVLKPAPGNPGGHDDNVPARRFRSRFALSVYHSGVERFLNTWPR